MLRSSKYHALRYIVECQPTGQAFFESIAAFNDDQVAIKYAVECLGGKPLGWKYRVVERRNNEPKCIYRTYRSDTEGLANVASA